MDSSRRGKSSSSDIYERFKIIKNKDIQEIQIHCYGIYGDISSAKMGGADVCVKALRKHCSEEMKKQFWEEANILNGISHPHVVPLYGVVLDAPDGQLKMVTEFLANGSIRYALGVQGRTLEREKKIKISMYAASGFACMHNSGISLFDFKSTNILVDLNVLGDPTCKVGDICIFDSERKPGDNGTLPWTAPELLKRRNGKVSKEKADIFSFGVVMWEILTGKIPYENMEPSVIVGGVVSGKLRPAIPSSCNWEWEHLMKECWEEDPEARPASFSEIVERLRAMLGAAE